MRPADIDDDVLLQRVLDEASGTDRALIFGDTAKELLIAHRVYLGFVDDAVVGCVMASIDEGAAIIHNLAVARAHRNRGHATTLVKSAMVHLDPSGSLTYWAAADPGNPSAVKRFHLLGFQTYDDQSSRNVILMVRQAGLSVPPAAPRRPRTRPTTAPFANMGLRPPAASSASND